MDEDRQGCVFACSLTFMLRCKAKQFSFIHMTLSNPTLSAVVMHMTASTQIIMSAVHLNCLLSAVLKPLLLLIEHFQGGSLNYITLTRSHQVYIHLYMYCPSSRTSDSLSCTCWLNHEPSGATVVLQVLLLACGIRAEYHIVVGGACLACPCGR